MSKYIRYKFIREIYENYVILIKSKNGYNVFEQDIKILKFIKFKGNSKLLDKYHINYLILDNLDIIYISNYPDNSYNTIYLKCSIIFMLEKIKYKDFIGKSFEALKEEQGIIY